MPDGLMNLETLHLTRIDKFLSRCMQLHQSNWNQINRLNKTDTRFILLTMQNNDLFVQSSEVPSSLEKRLEERLPSEYQHLATLLEALTLESIREMALMEYLISAEVNKGSRCPAVEG